MPLRVVVLGNSIAAGYGLRAEQAFPALVAQKAEAAGLRVTMVNAGISGETTAGGLARLGPLLDAPLDVLVVELGGNDLLRGVDPALTERNLAEIVRRTQARHPGARVVIAGWTLPASIPALPPYFAAYAQRATAIYANAARETGADLIPFLLDGVAGVAALNQPDRIHPTAEGQRRIADTAWRALEPILHERLTARAAVTG